MPYQRHAWQLNLAGSANRDLVCSGITGRHLPISWPKLLSIKVGCVHAEIVIFCMDRDEMKFGPGGEIITMHYRSLS